MVLSVCFLVVSSLCRKKLGRTGSATIRAGTLTWAATFGMTWLSLLALGLATHQTAAIALVGSWVESLVVAGVAVWWPDAPAENRDA